MGDLIVDRGALSGFAPMPRPRPIGTRLVVPASLRHVPLSLTTVDREKRGRSISATKRVLLVLRVPSVERAARPRFHLLRILLMEPTYQLARSTKGSLFQQTEGFRHGDPSPGRG